MFFCVTIRTYAQGLIAFQEDTKWMHDSKWRFGGFFQEVSFLFRQQREFLVILKVFVPLKIKIKSSTEVVNKIIVQFYICIIIQTEHTVFTGSERQCLECGDRL